MSRSRYYERFSCMPFEEDMTHEFKGHRNFCLEEIPSWATIKDENGRASRKPISRNLCGFLNTGQGGTVYCGVTDEGKVHGLALTQFQRDHIVGSVKDLLDRFTPAVPPHLYKVRFVPVMGTEFSDEQKTQTLQHRTEKDVNPELRKRKHIFRGSEYCWCDQESMANHKRGTLVPSYVIEVTILPWDPDNKKNEGLGSTLNLHPIYADDKKNIYFRRQASLCTYTMQEIATMTYFQAEKRKDDIVSRLKREIAELELSKKKSRPKPRRKEAVAGSSSKIESQTLCMDLELEEMSRLKLTTDPRTPEPLELERQDTVGVHQADNNSQFSLLTKMTNPLNQTANTRTSFLGPFERNESITTQKAESPSQIDFRTKILDRLKHVANQNTPSSSLPGRKEPTTAQSNGIRPRIDLSASLLFSLPTVTSKNA